MTDKQIEARAVQIAARIMQQAGLCGEDRTGAEARNHDRIEHAGGRL